MTITITLPKDGNVREKVAQLQEALRTQYGVPVQVRISQGDADA